MQKHGLIFGFLLLSHFLAAQSPKWINYANDGNVWDVCPTNEYVWVSTQGGLERIDRTTGQRKIFQPWNSGLRGMDVSAVDLAPDGKLWISGNEGGLFSFDGTDNWEQFYAINTGDTLIQIKDLEITPEGYLWFISYVNNNCSGCTKLFHYNGIEFSEQTDAFEAVLGNNGVRILALDQTGILWASSGYKLLEFDGVNITEEAIPLLTYESISDLAFDQNNTLWVGTHQYIQGSSNQIYRIRYFDGNIWSVLDESTLGGEILHVNRMFKNQNGNFYVSLIPTDGGGAAFAKFDGNDWEYTKIPDLPNFPSDPPFDLIAIDNQGHLWFTGYNGSYKPQVYQFDGQTWKTYSTEIRPLLSNHCDDVVFDCYNNTWFGGSGMLTKFDGVSWKDYTFQDIGINANHFAVWSFTIDTTTCDLWISFYDNNHDSIGFAKYDGNTFTTYSTPNENDVFETAVAKDGTVWVASTNSGLGKFDGNTWTWFNEQNSPIDNHLYSVTIDHAQNIWITNAYPPAILRWDNSNWLKFDQSNAPLDVFSDWVFVDHAGMIWTSNKSGLLRFNAGQWQAFPIPGTGISGVNSMAQDQAHNFWLSNRAGIHKWDGNTFESYNFIHHPLASAYNYRIRIDPFGNKWLVHGHAGVTVFNENGISNQIINPTAGVHGKVYFDANQDGQQGQASAEPGIPNEKVYLQPNNTAIFTNYDGNYTLFPPPGNYELRYTGSEDFTPTSAQSLPFIMGTNEQNGFNYGAWSENTEDSISLDMNVGLLRCNGEANVWLSLVGQGLLEASGDVTLLYDPALTYLHATPEPDLVQGNLLTWHYSGLSLYELLQINVVFQVPGVNAVGQILSLQSDATVLDGGVVTASAEKDERAEVRCSFDPNDKASASVGTSLDQYSLLNDALDFTIRFQNSGNDTAFTVVLRDTLDTSLDFSTLQIVSSSHTMRTSLSTEGVLTFVFDNINLLWESVDYAGSQGYVKYRIAPKDDLPDPTIVRNTAHIYFDFNPAIVTNTTLNVLVETLPSSGTSDVTEDALAARVYPNPNTGDFWIEWLDQATAQTSQVTVIDIAGRIHRQLSFVGQTTKIQSLAPGFYFVFLEHGGRMTCRKLVVTGD